MDNPLGIAVIGCGYWGGNYIRLFSELPDTRVIGVCDRKPESLEKVMRRFPHVRLTTDITDVLEMDGVEAVVVSTFATNHYEITRRCLEAGKHVLVEKPMTTNASEAEHLIELAQTRQLTLMVGHIYLYNDGIHKVKSYIDEGRIGQLYYLYTRRTNLGPIRSDVNALWDLAPHDICILNYFMSSPPVWVSAIGHRALGNSREDVGFVALGYPNNVIGEIHVSWVDPNKVREVVAVGSEMRIVFNDLNPQEPVRIYERGVAVSPSNDAELSSENRFKMRNGDIISPHLDLSEPLKIQGLHFVECVREGKQPLSNGINGLEVVRVMEAINRSMELGGAQVTLPARVEANGNGYHKEQATSLLR